MKDKYKADVSHTDEFNRMYQEMVKQAEDKYKVKSEYTETEDEIPLDKAGQMTDFEYEGLAYTLPEGYIFKDENGNVINATKIVLEKKKKEYPKTYEECCVLLGAVKDRHYFFTKKDKDDYPNEVRILNILDDLRRLLICRDAYWKIAGEEMGLGKPWEIDPHKPCYFIAHLRTGGIIKKLCGCVNGNANFAFPTEAMRDAFYENFKEEIENCKELL